MEETNRNIEIISMIRKWMEQGVEDGMRTFISEFSYKDYEKNALYVKCVLELKNIDNLQGLEYRKAAMDICDYYLDLASGNRFNKVKYDNELRKEKYRQLNLDMPKDLMDDFDYYLKQNNHTKKSVIQKAIEDYINSNKKNN